VPPSPIAARDAHLVGADGLVALVVDGAGNLYVSECLWTYAAIHQIDPHGMMTPFAGTGVSGYAGDGGPATSAQLFCPRGMAFGPDGAMYVGDHVNNRIRRIDAAGIIATVAGSGPTGVNQGSFSGDGGPATEATLQEPEHVAFDRAGNLYIGDRDNNRIRKVDPQGIITTIAGNGKTGYSGDGVLGSQTSIEGPYGVAVDAKGDVIFVDGANMRVRMIDLHGTITTIAGTGQDASNGDGGPATKAALEPQNLAVDASDNIYVTDDKSRSLRRIDGHGIITTIAGGGTVGVTSDGMAARQASFPGIGGVAVDGVGNVYVTDLIRVYRIDPKGVLTVVAGARG
jgi:sugar lactone lactonase YvrE